MLKEYLIVTVTTFRKYLIVTVTMFKEYLIVTFTENNLDISLLRNV